MILQQVLKIQNFIFYLVTFQAHLPFTDVSNCFDWMYQAFQLHYLHPICPSSWCLNPFSSNRMASSSTKGQALHLSISLSVAIFNIISYLKNLRFDKKISTSIRLLPSPFPLDIKLGMRVSHWPILVDHNSVNVGARGTLELYVMPRRFNISSCSLAIHFNFSLSLSSSISHTLSSGNYHCWGSPHEDCSKRTVAGEGPWNDLLRNIYFL